MLCQSKNQMDCMKRHQRLLAELAILIVFVLTGSACATTNSEEALIWCGPATAQMIIENDDKSGCPSSVLQEDLWTIIENNQVDSAWDTDPVGMEKALENSCTGWSWMPIGVTDEASFMHNVAYYIYRYEYPAAVVLDTLPHSTYPSHAEHWVNVLGVVTDQNPTTVPPGTIVNLEYVLYVDPSPPVFGDPAVIDLVSGTTWFTKLESVDKPASGYHGQYVAVIEPPEIKGLVKAKRQADLGEIISSERAIETAMHSLKNLMADDRAAEMMERYDLSRIMKAYGLPAGRPLENLERARPLEPMLVNRKRGAYYIVPLTVEGSKWQDHAQAAVAINAYDGSFQELGLFKPTQYANTERIIEVAGKLPQLRGEKIIDLDLVFPTTAHATHRLMPLWSVRTEKQQLLLDNQGNLVTLTKKRPTYPGTQQKPTTAPRNPDLKKQRIK